MQRFAEWSLVWALALLGLVAPLVALGWGVRP